MHRRIALGLALLLTLAASAQAVITADFPLKAVLKSEQHILVAKVEKLDGNPELPRMVLRIEENLKGKAPFEKATLKHIADLKRIYGLTLIAGDSHGLKEKRG